MSSLKKNYLLYFFIIIFVFCYSEFISYFLRESGLSGDENEYIFRAKNISLKYLNFDIILDYYRQPLYPLFLKTISIFFDFNVISIKFIQTFFSSVILIILSIILIEKSNLESSEKKKLIFLLLFVILNPINYFYSNKILSESLSLNLLIFFFLYNYILLTKNEIKKFDVFIYSIILIVVFYLKANNILYSLIFIFLFLKHFKKNKLNVILIPIIVFLAISPWIFAIYKATGHLKANNTYFINKLIGSGMLVVMYEKDLNTIHGKKLFETYINNAHYKERVAKLYKEYTKTYDGFNDVIYNLSNIILLENISKKNYSIIYNEFKNIQVQYKIDKLKHSLGFSLRDNIDKIFVVTNILFALCLIYLLYVRKFYLVLQSLIVFMIMSYQSTSFLPDLRFTIYYYYWVWIIPIISINIFLKNINKT